MVGSKAKLSERLRGLKLLEITIDFRYIFDPEGLDLVEMRFGRYKYATRSDLEANNPRDAHFILQLEAEKFKEYLGRVALDIDYKGYFVRNDEEECLGSLVED